MATTLSNRTRAFAIAAGLLVLGLALLVLARRLGEEAVPFLVLAVAAMLAVQRPGWALALLLVPAVLFEDSTEVGAGTFPNAPSLYEQSHFLSPLEALVGLAVVATALDVARRHELRTPEPMTFPLMLLGAALASGLIVGLFNGAAFNDVSTQMRPLIILIVVPFLIVNVIRDRAAMRRFLLVAAALATLKAIIGIATVIAGQGAQDPNDSALTYLQPTANWLSMAVLLVFIAMLVDRRRPPVWMYAVAILATTSLVLSYRRSFWIAAVAGILIVLLIGIGRLQWRTLIPSLAVLAAAVWLTVNTGVVGELNGPLAQRAESLNPSQIELNAEDRYRIGERRNVVADLENHPLTGLGLSVPWTGRFPPSVDRPRSREYVHFTALWWWLKLGILGLIAYVSLWATGIWTAFRVWREQHDPLLREVGLALAAALIALALAETTAAFTGVAARFSVIIGAAFGLLAAALADARRRADQVPDPGRPPPPAP